MKTAVILLALVAMAASQVEIVDNNPDLVQIVDHNPEQVQVVDNNPTQGQDDLHYDPNNFVVDPAFGRPGASVDPAFGRPGVNPGSGYEAIDKEPAFVNFPNRPQYPKLYDHPAWRGGK